MVENGLFDPPVTVHSTRSDGDTPLHVACIWGDVGAVELLLAGGAAVNARGEDHVTPLCYAVMFERVRCVERLLQAGATADDANELGYTARERARTSTNPRLRVLFGSHGQ